MPRPFTNPDRITWLILTRAAIAALVAVLAAWGIDLNMDEKKQGALADALLVIVPIVLTLAGAVWGSKDATKRVTPILPGDIPRDLDGNELVPKTHSPSTGYPPTRAATEAERYRRRPPPTS